MKTEQTNTPDPQLREQLDAKSKKFDEACDNNDAAAVAALFTEDALLVEPGGLFSGRQDIERRYADTFQRSPVISFNSGFERHYLNAIDNAVWGAGQWTSTFQRQNGSVFALGYWSAIYVREGDAWKIRVLTFNEQPPPAPRAETK